jgi:hypothetical protein
MFIFSRQKGMFSLFSTARDVHILWIERDVFIARTVIAVHIFWRGGDVYIREAREGLPLLTVETEANGDSRSTYERGPSLVVSLGSSIRDFCPSLAAVVYPIQDTFLLKVHFFTSFVLIAQQAGQAVVPRHLSLNMVSLIDTPEDS